MPNVQSDTEALILSLTEQSPPRRVEVLDDEGNHIVISHDAQGDILISVAGVHHSARFVGPGGGGALRPLTRLVLRMFANALAAEGGKVRK